MCPCSVILYFNCSEKEMTTRLVNRGKTSGRVDDNEETIKKRLDTFHAYAKEIEKLEKLYAAEGKFESVNSERSVDAVFADVEIIMAKLLAK